MHPTQAASRPELIGTLYATYQVNGMRISCTYRTCPVKKTWDVRVHVTSVVITSDVTLLLWSTVGAIGPLRLSRTARDYGCPCIQTRAYRERVSTKNNSGNEVKCTNAWLLLIEIMLCSKLHCKKVSE